MGASTFTTGQTEAEYEMDFMEFFSLSQNFGVRQLPVAKLLLRTLIPLLLRLAIGLPNALAWWTGWPENSNVIWIC